MRLFLQFFTLSDRYERKARLLPGLLLATAPALTAGSVLQEFAGWYVAASAAVGIEFLVAIVLGHYARARGRAAEDRLWELWGGPPTTRWLRPSDGTCSNLQKSRWRSAIKRITGLTLPATTPEGTNEVQLDRIIGDATRQLRYSLRGRPDTAILATHNEDYGFARNLYGIRWLWVMLCLACLLACGVAFALGLRPFMGTVVALSATAVSLLVASQLTEYVRRCADRYAESLFASAIVASQAMDKAERRSTKAASAESS